MCSQATPRQNLSGWQVKIKPFERSRQIPILLGLFYTTEGVETMHGTYQGLNLETPLTKVEAKVGDKTVTSYMGHALYLTSGADGKGGGSSSALNHINSEVWGGGMAQSASSSFGVVGMVAIPCEYDAVKAGLVAKAEPKAPANTCTAKRAGPGVKKGDPLTYEGDKMPAECGG